MRRDKKFWGWIVGNPSRNHLWREEPGAIPALVHAKCHHAMVEATAVQAPLNVRKDGTPPVRERCADCNWMDWFEAEQKRAAK